MDYYLLVRDLGNLEVKTRSIETGERLIDWFLKKCSAYDHYSRLHYLTGITMKSGCLVDRYQPEEAIRLVEEYFAIAKNR